MITTRQVEKLWTSKMYDRLLAQLLALRPEATPRLFIELRRAIPMAAMAVIRLDELNQSHTAIYSQLLRVILAAQEADGGWGDPMATALCIRALLCGNGDGLAIDQGIDYLAHLQKADGLWPSIPIRRTNADPFVSAFILLQLGGERRFTQRVNLESAVAWFEEHSATLDVETAQLWRNAAYRCRGNGPRPHPVAA